MSLLIDQLGWKCGAAPQFASPVLSTNIREKSSSPLTAHLYMRWQFASDSSHGRRACCGVTAFIKPAADRVVTYRNSDDGMSVLSAFNRTCKIMLRDWFFVYHPSAYVHHVAGFNGMIVWLLAWDASLLQCMGWMALWP